ncbi:MAG: hypothetical protein WCG77_08595 [Actinomycetes bacterium]
MLVFVDTNVWYPVVLADLVLRSVEIGLFDLAWTDESLAEVERVLVERKGLTAQHAAAARGARADVLLTSNVTDFPATDVGPACRVLHPSDLFGELASTYPIEVRRVIAEMAAHRHRPPMTPDDILDRLDALGLHPMVSALRPTGPDEAD